MDGGAAKGVVGDLNDAAAAPFSGEEAEALEGGDEQHCNGAAVAKSTSSGVTGEWTTLNRLIIIAIIIIVVAACSTAGQALLLMSKAIARFGKRAPPSFIQAITNP